MIKRLRDEGLIGCDYIILSRYSLTNPLNFLHDVPLSSNIGTLKTGGQIWKAKKNEVRFSTISAFKGLEAKAVILIDVDNFSAASARLLNYVAISRACALLYILYDEKRESERQNMLLTGFLNI